jgi:uncharacterized cupredoxin-like copper-binding protein
MARESKLSTPGAIAMMVGAHLVGVALLVGLAVTTRGNTPGGSSGASKVEVSLASGFKISGALAAKPGVVTLNVKNTDTLVHNLALEGSDKKTTDLSGGGSAELSLGKLEAGTYTVYCGIAGHRDSGMQATLVVGEASDAAQSTSHDHTNATPEEWAQWDQTMIDNMKSFLDNASKGDGTTGNALIQPEIQADGTKLFKLTAEITDWEVEAGKTVKAWTYNKIVPGPWIKVNLNDKVKVQLTNKTPGITDIHFHGVHVPNTQDGVSPYTQDPIKSGDTYTYEFVADKPALGMYHAHAHGEVAVVNGMFAIFQVGETVLPNGKTVGGVKLPDRINPVQEIPMVLNDAGAIGFSLNGKSFPATAPYVFNKGDWFVVHYFNEGLQSHPMHMHGFPQIVIAKDGYPLDSPYWLDTINVAPGERVTLLVQASDPGAWVWHCHILNHVEQKDRLFGMATAVVVK